MYYNEKTTSEKLKKLVRLAAPISYRKYCYKSAQLRALGLRFGDNIYTLIYCNYPLDSHEAACQVELIEAFIDTMV